MNRATLFPLATLLAVSLPLQTGRADDRPNPPGKQDYMRQVRDAAREVVRNLERLQDTVVSDLAGRKERVLYRQTERALGEALSFQNALKEDASRVDLYERFDKLDEQLHKLLESVGKVEDGQHALHRAARYLRATDDQLHYALSSGDTTKARKQQIIRRQARVLAYTAEDLKTNANYSLGESPGRGVLLAELDKFYAAAEKFAKAASSQESLKELRQDFEAINKSWEQVSEQLKKLPPKENFYFLRNAVRIDNLHERLFQLLEMKGKRPGITVQT